MSVGVVCWIVVFSQVSPFTNKGVLINELGFWATGENSRFLENSLSLLFPFKVKNQLTCNSTRV